MAVVSWLARILAPTAASLAIAALVLSPAAAGAAARLAEGRLLLSESPEPPPDDAPGWQRVVLPDEWARERPEAEGHGWYRFALPAVAPAGGEPLAVYLPELNLNASVWVNGTPIGSCAPFDLPVALCWNRPLLLTVPPALLTGDGDHLHVRLFASRPYGGLSPVLFGARAELEPAFAQAYRLQIVVPQAFTVLAAVVFLFMAMLAIGTRDSAYGWFGAIVLAWAVAMLNYWAREVPMPFPAWEWLAHHSFDWIGPLCAVFTHRLLGLERPWLERAFLGYLVVAAVATALVAGDRVALATVTSVTHAGTLLIGLYAQLVLFWFYRQLNVLQRWFFVLGGGCAVILGAHDIAIQLGWLGRDELHMFAFAAPMLVVSFSVILTVRFLATFNRARRLNVELEDRVREKQREVEASFEQVRHMEKEQAVVEERNRIMREVHDGVGGSIVSTLALIETRRVDQDQIAASLRAAIQDIRLVIDSLDPSVRDLGTLLGLLRARIDQQVRHHGLRFDWRVGDLPAIERFGPTEFLHVARIAQEAITNALRHAGAQTITVSTSVIEGATGRRAVIEIRDDGAGMRDSHRGRGLGNMEVRAARLGAEFSVADAQGGTAVRLAIACDRPGAEGADAETRP